MKKRIIVATMVLIISLNATVFASPIEDDGVSVNIDSVLTKISEIESEVQRINRDIYDVEDSIKEAENRIVKVKKEIELNNKDIEKKSKEIEAQSVTILDTAKLAYINNVNSNKQYIEVLLNSRSMKDFAQRFFAIKEIITLNKNKLNSFIEDKKYLNEKQNEVLKQKEDLNKMLMNLNKEYETLTAKKEVQESKLKEYKDMKIQYEAEIAENELRICEYVATISEEVDYVEEEDVLDEYDGGLEEEVVTGSSTTGSALVNIALKYLGVPYVWGGTSPSGFDCSGFVQYVYREAGINISRTTYTQIQEGYPVSDLQPGDLVFFGSYSDPYHVGMYIGDGQYIHSPTTGDVVKVATLQYRGDYCGARRYI